MRRRSREGDFTVLLFSGFVLGLASTLLSTIYGFCVSLRVDHLVQPFPWRELQALNGYCYFVSALSLLMEKGLAMHKIPLWLNSIVSII